MSSTVVDRGEILRQLREFGAHWADSVATWVQEGTPHTEKSFAQSFWSDLLGCFNINTARLDLLSAMPSVRPPDAMGTSISSSPACSSARQRAWEPT